MLKIAGYTYTVGGALAGALAGAAITKLLEDEDKKATLKDYLLGSGIGLGLGAIGGRLADTASSDNGPADPEAAAMKENADKLSEAQKLMPTDDDKPNFAYLLPTGAALGLTANLGGKLAINKKYAPFKARVEELVEDLEGRASKLAEDRGKVQWQIDNIKSIAKENNRGLSKADEADIQYFTQQKKALNKQLKLNQKHQLEAQEFLQKKMAPALKVNNLASVAIGGVPVLYGLFKAIRENAKARALIGDR